MHETGVLGLFWGMFCTRLLKSESLGFRNGRLQHQGCARNTEPHKLGKAERCRAACCPEMSEPLLLSDTLAGVSTGFGKIVYTFLLCSGLGQELIPNVTVCSLYSLKITTHNQNYLDVPTEIRDFYEYCSLHPSSS